MARRPNTDFAAWPALTLEGNLIAPAMIARVANQRPSEKEEATYGMRKGLTIRDEITLAFRVGQAHYDDFVKLTSPSLPATTRFVSGLLTEDELSFILNVGVNTMLNAGHLPFKSLDTNTSIVLPDTKLIQ